MKRTIYILESIFLIIIFIVGVSSADIRKSSQAASSITRSSTKAFENPYVTDGLVAMWDGVWNIGWGKHDPNGGLVELISKIPTYVRRGSYVVEDDCIIGSNVVIASPPIPSIVAMAGGDITIEGVCRRTSRGIQFGANRPFFIDNAGGFYWSNNYYYMVHSGLTDSSLVSKWASGFSTDKRLARTLTANSEKVQWWLNGVGDTSSPRTKELITYNNPFAIFGWDFDYGFPESGEFCCLRIYNRALTAEEIAFNYAIDKERFGL